MTSRKFLRKRKIAHFTMSKHTKKEKKKQKVQFFQEKSVKVAFIRFLTTQPCASNWIVCSKNSTHDGFFFNKLASVFHASVVLLIMNFVIALSKWLWIRRLL